MLKTRRRSLVSQPVLNPQERKLDQPKTEPGNDYDAGKPNGENYEASDGKRVYRPEIVIIHAEQRHMREICAIRNPAEENKRWEIQEGWSSPLQATQNQDSGPNI